MQLHEEIIGLVKWRANTNPDEYINPHFISELSELIENYYNINMYDDITIEKYIKDMWGR